MLSNILKAANATEDAITFITSASVSSTTPSIQIPAGAQVGDIVVVFNAAARFFTSTIPTKVVPSGFTEIRTTTYSQFNGAIRTVCSYKKLVSGDPGSTITGMNSDNEYLIVFVFRSLLSNVTVQSSQGEGTTSAPSAQTITSGSGVAPFIAFAHWYGSVSGPAINSNGGLQTTTNSEQAAGYEIFNFYDPLSNIQVSMNDGGLNVLESFYLELS
jgi:hypothetical protein